MLSIDADAHVIEAEKTWDYLEGSYRRYRPVPITVDMPTGKTQNFWIIGGRLIGGRDNICKDTSKESREMANIDSRLKHMDEIGTGVQVLYPTLFLRPVTDNPRIELALCRSYNRWRADIWSKAKDRLRWAVQLPLLTMEKALDELRWARGKAPARCSCAESKPTIHCTIPISSLCTKKRAGLICRSVSTRASVILRSMISSTASHFAWRSSW
jgi:predicted TIM-barrel fold metal-dependent hydrolase